jgi:hypothetical protein
MRLPPPNPFIALNTPVTGVAHLTLGLALFANHALEEFDPPAFPCASSPVLISSQLRLMQIDLLQPGIRTGAQVPAGTWIGTLPGRGALGLAAFFAEATFPTCPSLRSGWYGGSCG